MDVLAPTEIVVWYLVRNTFVLTYFETIYFYVTTKHKKGERKTKIGNPRRSSMDQGRKFDFVSY